VSNMEKQYIETTASDSDENEDIPDISSLDVPESADINDNERSESENVKETELLSSSKREPLKMKFSLKNNTTSENRLAKEDSNNLIDNSKNPPIKLVLRTGSAKNVSQSENLSMSDGQEEIPPDVEGPRKRKVPNDELLDVPPLKKGKKNIDKTNVNRSQKLPFWLDKKLLDMRPIIVLKRQRKVEKMVQIYEEEESRSKSNFDELFLSEALTLNITDPKFESLIIKNPQPIVPFRPPNKKKQFVKKKFECRKCSVNFDSYDERHQHYLNLHVENSGPLNEILARENDGIAIVTRKKIHHVDEQLGKHGEEVEATQKLQQKEKRVKCIEDNCNLEFDSREKMFAHYMTHVEC